MSGIGRVGASPTPIPDDTTAPASTASSTASASATPTTSASRTARPVPPSGPPTAGDIVPASILTKYGLDPTKPSTDSKYDGAKWSVGYYPYTGDIQYAAFGKYKNLFGQSGAGGDGHGYWEAYGNPPSGLQPGSWIASGSIDESNFETASGVDISGNRPIDNAAYKLLREAGAPADAKFALRDASGKQLAVRPGDTLLPTINQGGKLLEVELRGTGGYFKKGTDESVPGDVVWRLKGKDGQVRGAASDKAEDRLALSGASDGVKFDFLDAAGEPIPMNPGDQAVATYKDGDKWNAFVPRKDASGRVTGFEHQTLDASGTRVTSRETVAPARAKALQKGKDVMYRIQERTGALKGDGKVGGSYDMGWWGKCDNVAAIGASSMKLPEKPVKVVTNQGPGDTVALQWKEGRGGNALLVPQRGADGGITGYKHTGPGPTDAPVTRDISVDEGNRLAAQHQADGAAVLVGRDGKVKPAEVTTVSPDEVTALTAHMGDGAVKYEGSVGSRYYGTPDQIKLKDGSTKGAFITDVTTASGKKVNIGSKFGTGDFEESDRSALRGPGLKSQTINNGWRQVAWSSESLDQLQASKAAGDKIQSFNVAYPDGRTETISADKVASLGWENKYDVTPTDLWSMHKKVGAKGSSVIEQDPGTHVWNYTIEGMSTKALKPAELSASDKEAAKKPGMMAGTTGEDGKYFFETTLNSHDYKYWAKFDAQGNMKDYGYLGQDVPDFFWTQHVKDPIAEKWTGEGRAPGVRMEDVQRLYNASTGALKKYEAPGGFIGSSDLLRPPVRP